MPAPFSQKPTHPPTHVPQAYRKDDLIDIRSAKNIAFDFNLFYLLLKAVPSNCGVKINVFS